ncbi:TlpA disulfide reductase family protein [Nonlabens sp.]|uniref:TlpA disulfide reductase family protein n=1 Tax=Nonlabens sp. TaxID=1888209 RepID=UPI001BCE70F7|nr:TlpA disulfide reductase family protein [Nonlabens sp.]
MKWNLLIAFLILSLVSCDQRPIAKAVAIDQNGLQQALVADNEKIKVINFWATWCAPCVEELPYFEKIGASYKNQVEVILISLDDAKNITSEVQPFLENNQIRSQVLLLDDPYAAEWIPIVDQHWDGAIPVTLIISKDKKQFYNKALTYKELEDAINEFL